MGCIEVKTHYLPFQIWVIARMDPLKYFFEKPALSGRLSRWLILLVEFNLKYAVRKTIKGSIVSDFCVDVHEIYTIKYSHIYIFSLTFMLFCV